MGTRRRRQEFWAGYGAADPAGGGRITLGGEEWSALPESVTGRKMNYVPAGAYLFPLSVRET